MGSTSANAAATKSILKPEMTLNGHREYIPSISYFPGGQRMISGSWDKTIRQWDLKAGREIEEAQNVCEGSVLAVAVSRDGRWVVTGGGGWTKNSGELKACEVDTGTVKIFEGHSQNISCIDISMDNTLLASGSEDKTARIWNLDTGKLVAGPFGESEDGVGAVRFSPDSKKLAVKLRSGRCLDVWDIRSQKLDVRVGEYRGSGARVTSSSMFWTNNNKNIIAAFSFTEDVPAKKIYEFNASTLEAVGAPFEGHTRVITSLALSFDGALLVSSSGDNTTKLWAFESRQLLASFDIRHLHRLILSPNSRQLAYTVDASGDYKIYICNIPRDILAQTSARKKSAHRDLLNSDATRRPPAGHRRPPISAIPMSRRPPPTRDTQQPVFIRLQQLLHFTSRTNAGPVQPHNPLDVPATSPLPSSSLSGQAATRFNHFEISSPPPPSNGVTQFLRHHLSFLVPRHNLGPQVVEVAPGRKVTRLAAAKFPEYKKVDDTRHSSSQQGAVPQENDTADIDSLPDVHWCKAFLCYYSCWSHGRLRMPPRWRLERVDIPRQDGTTSGGHGGTQGRT